jgi:hypothetical protein
MRFKPAASDEKAKSIGDEILPARLTATKGWVRFASRWTEIPHCV